MKKKKLLSLLFLIQIIVVKLLSFFPEFVEKWYSNGIYVYISGALRVFFGFFGFSIGDIIYGIVIIMGIRWLWQRRKTWRHAYKYNLVTMLATLSVVYFLFNILWAFNYHRIPLYKKMEIEKEYTLDELTTFTKKLIIKTNALQVSITRNDTVKVVIPYSVGQIYNNSVTAYSDLSQQFPYFKYEHESVKSSLFSIPLSYMGFGGYLNPFTNEAQVNSELPLYNLPTTTCHEMAHQIGFANESEANFIGFMASIKSRDAYFQYSGYSFALKYCMRNIAKLDKKRAKSLAPLINKGILGNFKESEQFNKKYESFVEGIFKYIYDNYLKINRQKDGLETYSKFVGLMVNYYSDKEL
jgi:hypothetical protein